MNYTIKELIFNNSLLAKLNIKNTNKKRQYQCMAFSSHQKFFLLSNRRLKSAQKEKHKAAFTESCKGLEFTG